MKTFEENINKESNTIKEFINTTGNAVKMRKMMNEGYSRYDFTFSLKNTVYLTEVKTRNVSKNRYSDTILEQSKIDAIQSIADDFNMSNASDFNIKVGFLVSFSCGGMYFFDINKVKTTTSIMPCPKTSSTGGSQEVINKKLRHFRIEDGVKIK